MRITAIALAASLFLASGCSGPESVQQGRAKVDTFHRQLDKGDYEAIWADTSQDIRLTSTKESFLLLLNAIHTKLGRVKETKQIGWKANVDTSGSFAELTMKTAFEHGTGEEIFTFRNGEKVQKLAGYRINSNDLMMK